ncbi:MAG: hypothetical protein QM783_05625 [Phycisphaerales bacterium]
MSTHIEQRELVDLVKKAIDKHGGPKEWHFSSVDKNDIYLFEGMGISSELPSKILGFAVVYDSKGSFLLCNDGNRLSFGTPLRTAPNRFNNASDREPNRDETI